MKHKFYIDVDYTTSTLNKKIKQAQDEQYSFIVVLGQKEVETQLLSVRQDNVVEVISIDTLISKLLLLI